MNFDQKTKPVQIYYFLKHIHNRLKCFFIGKKNNGLPLKVYSEKKERENSFSYKYEEN